ncbi:hypothetical protein BSQ44_08615 [Aquibium oceanicum]|uniref:Uncharacterized protein n=2 Tax=Aquibium oceanicum TaxID=1670800 RepID=A0A1L3SPY6_9HYPH|nr:hypothetical protein BSQ44_08615 [Aquibium oceanicum]
MGDRIKIRIDRKPDPTILLPDGTQAPKYDGSTACADCGLEMWLIGHRNFVARDDERPDRIEGSLVDICLRCAVKVQGILTYGRNRNVTMRDHQTIVTCASLVRAIEREARHA